MEDRFTTRRRANLESIAQRLLEISQKTEEDEANEVGEDDQHPKNVLNILNTITKEGLEKIVNDIIANGTIIDEMFVVLQRFSEKPALSNPIQRPFYSNLDDNVPSFLRNLQKWRLRDVCFFNRIETLLLKILLKNDF